MAGLPITVLGLSITSSWGNGHATTWRALPRGRFAARVAAADVVRAGRSPSVRLFEAAACGVPVGSAAWPGLEELLTPGREILGARGARDVVRPLAETGEDGRRALAAAARDLAAHTATARAVASEREVLAVDVGRARLAAGA